MSTDEQFQLGVVCGQCDAFNALGTASCASCGGQLTLGGPATSLRPAAPKAEPPRPVAAEPPRPAAPAAPPMPGVKRSPRKDIPTPRLAAKPIAAKPAPAVAPRPQIPVPRPASVPKARPAAENPKTAKKKIPVAEEKPMEPARHYVCRSCASAVPRGHKFCGRCGTPVPAKIREMREDFFGDMQNPNKAKLILIRGEGMDGLSFHLKAEQHIVGREGQLIFPDDPFVSPKHANFFYRDGKLVVRDEGSLNGVYIRIRGTVPMQPDATFLAGEQLFRLEAVGPVTDDGPDGDGTVFYASPRRESTFQLCQIFRGGAVGMRVQAHGTSMVVGRDGADLNFPEDLFMSGEHCRIDESDGRFTITDLNSRNGTYVRIDEERDLEHGDFVFIGRKLLRVEVNTN